MRCHFQVTGLTVALLTACVPDPVVWGASEYLPPGAVAEEPAVEDEAVCSAAEYSFGGHRYRAGWSRTNGQLLVRKSSDSGMSWEAAVVADSTAQSGEPCMLPAPAVFVDTLFRFVHVAYFSEARGGAGVYYVHSMNAERLAPTGEGMFEQPLALTYGTRPVRTAVAARGDTVIVAYEDPNSVRGGIQLALSSAAGHSFDKRVVVARTTGVSPRIGLRAGEVTLIWRETAEPRRWVRREGKFR